MNYIFFELEKINFNNFFKDIKKPEFQEEKILVSDFISIYEKHLIIEFQNYSIKNKLNISDYVINFKVNYHADKNKLEIEIEAYRTFIHKFEFFIEKVEN